MRAPLALRVAALASCIVSCESKRIDPPADRLAAIREACAELAAVWCADAALCRSASFATEYGGEQACVARRASLCERTQLGQGSRLEPGDLRACARASDQSSRATDERCKVFFARELTRKPVPDACAAPGQLDAGERCAVGSQCLSASCLPTSLTCGRCGPAREQAASCFDHAECAPGLACVGFRCRPLAGQGGGCPCEPSLACIDGTCAPRRPENEPCEPGLDQCQLWPAELGCSAARKRCEPHVVAGRDEPCGELDDGSGSVARCEHGLTCKATAHPRKGSCVPVGEDRTTCAREHGAAHKASYPFGGPCRAPAVCAGGWCDLPSAAACDPGALP